MRSVRLLLVNPATNPSFWGFEYAMDLQGGAYSNAPLSLLTIAALTPSDWHVELQDENVRPIDLDTPCDIVGISLMNVQFSRAVVLAHEFRRRGRLVVMGGPFPTLEPERCASRTDVLFVGEAEHTWPEFCTDFAQGAHKRRYVEAEHVDVRLSPTPRFDLIAPRDYASFPIQTSRGCPYGCEFCDIIVMQGRRVRSKTTDQVMAEVDAVRHQHGTSIFFTDDNFVGNIKLARTVLERIAEHRRETGFCPPLFTQASLDLADRSDLLDKMVEAGFSRVFLGIESPRHESLREAGKRQNARGNMLERVQAIQRAGLMTWAGMIVGFDHDDRDIFAEQAEFLDQAGIAVAMVGLLNAPPRTPLFQRLKRENRIDASADWTDNCCRTNIIPKRMSRADLFAGYAELLQEIFGQEAYARRVLTNIGRMLPRESAAGSARPPRLADVGDLCRAIALFTFSRDAAARRHFVPNLLRIARLNPSRVVEGAIHLGMWRHFQKYVPGLILELERAASRERALRRTRDPYSALLPGPAHPPRAAPPKAAAS